MFNFPNTPSLGAVYQPVGGPSYTWDGTKWVMTGSLLQQAASYSARNRIVNSAFQISQENGNTASAANAYYAADQWVRYWGTTGTITTQRVQVATPNGSRNRWRTTITVADAALAAGDYIQHIQQIEGIRVADFCWGTAQAKQVIVRFGWKSPAGTYSVSLMGPSGSIRAYIANFTISAAQANTDTEQIIVVPGDTSGTWLTDTGIGVTLCFCQAAGTTYQGVTGWQTGNFFATSATSNGMATAGAVFEFWDVGLYLDQSGTGIPPAWEMPDELDELRLCLRYWRKNIDLRAVAPTAGTQFRVIAPLDPSMRVTPAIGYLGGNMHVWSIVNAGGVSMTNSATTASHLDIYWNVAAAQAAQQESSLQSNALTLSARM